MKLSLFSVDFFDSYFNFLILIMKIIVLVDLVLQILYLFSVGAQRFVINLLLDHIKKLLFKMHFVFEMAKAVISRNQRTYVNIILLSILFKL